MQFTINYFESCKAACGILSGMNDKFLFPAGHLGFQPGYD